MTHPRLPGHPLAAGQSLASTPAAARATGARAWLLAALLAATVATGTGRAADDEPHFARFTGTLHEQSLDFEQEWTDPARAGSADASAEALARIARAANDPDQPYTLKDLDVELRHAPEKYRSLRRKLDSGRHRLVDRLICLAIPEANAQLARLGQQPLRRFKTVNSGSTGDVTRDIDLTAFGGDRVREEAFFAALKKVAWDRYKIECDYSPGKGLRIKSLDVAFHLGSLDTPELNRCVDLQSFALDYQSVIEGETKNPEAYIGWGADTEAKGRRMQTFKKKGMTRMKVYWVGADGAVKARGFRAKSWRAARAMLNAPVEQNFSAGKRAMNIVSSLLQAAGHEKEAQLAAERQAAQQRDYEQGRRKTRPPPPEADDPSKGPLKYAERAVEQLVQIRHPGTTSTYQQLEKADRLSLVASLFPRGALDDPAQRKVIEAHVKMLDNLPGSLQGKAPPDSQLEWETRKALAFLRKAASTTVVEVARQMLNPPFDADFVAEQVAKAGWDDLPDTQQRKLAAQVEKNYRKAVAIEALENMLAAMWTLKRTKLPSYRPGDETFADATIGQILDEARRLKPQDPELARVIELAAEYGEAYEAHRLAHSNTTLPRELLEATAADAARRMSRIRVELLERILGRPSPGKKLLDGAAAESPKRFIRAGFRSDGDGPDLTRVRGVMRAQVDAMLGDEAERVRRAVATVETDDSGKHTTIGRRVWDELFSLDTVVDILNLVEAAQKGASPGELGKQLGLMALSRVHWSIGLAIGYARAKDDPEAMTEFEKALVFMPAAMIIPHVGLVKVIADIEIGLVKVTVEPLFESLDAELVRLRYLTGDVTVLDEAFKVYSLENGAEKIDVDRVKLFKEKFRLWTGEGYDDYGESWRDGRPVFSRATPSRKCPALVAAHDRYARATCRIVARSGPLWPTVSEEKADRFVPGADEVERLAQEIADTVRPLIRAEVDAYLWERWTRTSVRRGEEGQNKDRIAAALVTAYLADFLTGLESTWKTDLAEQLMAKNRVERDAALADLDAAAQGLRVRLDRPSTGPFPGVELRPVDDAESLEEIRNGEQRVPVACELVLEGTRPDDMPGVDVEIEPGPARPADPARPTVEPGSVVITPITFRAIRVDTGAEVASRTIEVKVRLPGKKAKLELKTYVEEFKQGNQTLVMRYTYYDGSHPDVPASWKRTEPPAIQGFSFGARAVVHGTLTVTVNQAGKGSYTSYTAQYDHGLCVGTWKGFYPDGSVKSERTFSGDRVVSQTEYHEKNRPKTRWTYRPAGANALTADGEIVELTREGRVTAKGAFVGAQWGGERWGEGRRHGPWELSTYEQEFSGKGPPWLRSVERGSYDRGEKTGTWTCTFHSFRDHSKVDSRSVTEYAQGGAFRLVTETDYHPDGRTVRRVRRTRPLQSTVEVETLEYDEKGKLELHTVATRDLQGRETVRRVR